MFPRMLTRVRHDGARRRASDVPERQTGVAGVMAGWRIVIFTLGCLATLALAPAALANVIHFLASRDAEAVTGALIPVNGRG